MRFGEISQNQWHQIQAVKGSDEVQLRLTELGFTRGANFRIVGRAPFGSPFFVEIKGAVIALRENEAECIQI